MRLLRLPYEYHTCSVCSLNNLAAWAAEPGDCIISSNHQYLCQYLCSDCRCRVERAWIYVSPQEDLLLGVNYEWATKVLKEIYKRRLAGGGSTRHETIPPTLL